MIPEDTKLSERRQTQKEESELWRQKVRWWGPGAGGGLRILLLRAESQFGEDENVLEVDACTTV